jgi:SAM-dependent methyltransferase
LLRELRKKAKLKKRSNNRVWRFLFYIYSRWGTYGIRLQEEIAYWDEFLESGKRDPWMEEAISQETRRKQFPFLLLPYVAEIKRNKGEVSVLDVGCGPLSPLAWGAEEGLFSLTAVDPLAHEYTKMLKKHNISYPVKPIKGRGEKLLKLFPEESFDIVYSRNALDHAADIEKCIENIRRVLKKGGIFFLESLVREGTHNSWGGLHKHDLIVINGELMHFDRAQKQTRLASQFACLYHEQKAAQPGEWFKIIFKK